MRATEYRDSIFIEWRLARQIPDLIQDLNETRPHVLHFSGHGNAMELAFEDSHGLAVPLENDQLDGLLAAAPEPIRLVLFNSCNSAAQAELAVSRVELAIGMDATVEDEVAQVFAGQFYNSLGFGLSVQTAFDQAKWQVEVECGRGQEIPRLFHGEGVEPNVVVLVNPD
jgi:CHAT domain-containing protein